MTPVTILVSIIVVSLLVGLVLKAFPKATEATTKTGSESSSTPTPTPTDKASSPSEAERTHDEPKGTWEWLGFADDTPNLIRCAVTGSTGKGQVIAYLWPKDGYERKWYESLTGLRQFGPPFFSSLRTLDIDRVVLGRTQSENDNPNLIDDIEATGIVRRRGLKERFPRPIYHARLDTKDKVKINLTTQTMLRVIDPSKAFENYSDGYLQTISQTIRDFVSVQVWAMNFDDVGKVDLDLKVLNSKLLIFGVVVEQMTTSDPEIVKGSEEVQKAMEAVIIAAKKAEAAKHDAQARREAGLGERDYKVTISEGEAKAIERLAQAEAKRFDELRAAYERGGLDKIEAIRRAQETVIAEFNADAIGKLTYYAAGNQGPQLTVPAVAKDKGDKK